MKQRISAAVIGLLLVSGLIVVGWSAFNVQGLAATPEKRVERSQAAPAQNSATQLAGAYSGAVELGVTVGGVYSDTLATPPPPSAGTPAPPDLGAIDLSLQLTQTGSALSGYVRLDKTLVFSVEHTLQTGDGSIEIGPYVSGSFDGTNLRVESEKVSLVVSGQAIQRQFRLTGTSTADDGSEMSGEYRETLWGYTSAPVTVIGTFRMERPVFDDIAPVEANPAPVVGADQVRTPQGQAITINVLANDSAANGGTLTITSVSTPQFGTASTNGQTITYTPNADFTGSDSFSYVISDGRGGSATGSVTVVVGEGGGLYLPTIFR